MINFGVTNTDFQEESQSNTDFSTCPFKPYKDYAWNEITDINYLFWLLDNIDDLHPAYRENIEAQVENYDHCEQGHIWETFIANECPYCSQKFDQELRF